MGDNDLDAVDVGAGAVGSVFGRMAAVVLAMAIGGALGGGAGGGGLGAMVVGFIGFPVMLIFGVFSGLGMVVIAVVAGFTFGYVRFYWQRASLVVPMAAVGLLTYFRMSEMGM